MPVSLAKKVSLVKKSDVELRGFRALSFDEWLRCVNTFINHHDLKRHQLSV